MRRGQALIVILLILAVALTVGLAISSRSVTEVATSTTQDEAARALAAAEAGIESALGGTIVAGTGQIQVGTTGSTYTVSKAAFGGGANVVLTKKMESGDVETVFLSGHDENGVFVPGLNKFVGNQVMICWGQGVSGGDAAAPAVEATFYYQKGNGRVRVGRAALDPNAARRAENGFNGTTNWVNWCPTGGSYVFSEYMDLRAYGYNPASGDQPLFLRLRLMYNGSTQHSVGMSSGGLGGNFPDQGEIVSSLGQAGTASQRVEVQTRYADLPLMFDNAIFSGAGITK